MARDRLTANVDGLFYATRAGRWVIAATVMGSGMAALDATVVGIALPTIGRRFHIGVAGLQWVVSAYLLTLAGLLLLGEASATVTGAAGCSSSGWSGSRLPRWRVVWRRMALF